MKIALIILLGLVLCFAYFSYPIYRALSITKKIEAGTVAYEQHPAHPTMKILVTGDSTAVGTGADDPQYSTAGRLGQDFPTADITNTSENGLKLGGLETLESKLDSSDHYDLILIQIGANDITGMTSLAEIQKELAAVLDLAVAHSTHVIILTASNLGVSPIFRFPLSSFITYRTLEVRALFHQEVSSYPSVQYVDLFEPPAEDPFAADPGKYYAADLYHPSSDGYGVWYEGIKNVLKTDGLIH